MKERILETVAILEHLVSFQTISGTSTEKINQFIIDYLKQHDVEPKLSYDEDGIRSNVFATIGPEIDGGVLFNGHTDVVPVKGQKWATDPFKLTQIDDRLYGRGSVDMKGFLACMLASVPIFKRNNLKKPVHLTFSYDEETGGFGMPVLLESMALNQFQPSIVVVGEPTEMKIITGHKGSYEMRTEISGYEVHSSNPLIGVNAISIAMKLISKIEEIGLLRAANPIDGSPYDPPFATFNVGIIEGGTASNATAGWCNFDWEYRPMPGEDGSKTILELEKFANEELLPEMKKVSTQANIDIITQAPVGGLDDRNAAEALSFITAITGLNSTGVVSFGTDAGYFSDKEYSTV
ncbi:MAG: M20/M25/M40 family metallo-hydrolase, partial [Paracoccaceae bacterium]|nr:M20/M25/M40 family metallo-hydrolase [Paracoccaceae bacterium]